MYKKIVAILLAIVVTLSTVCESYAYDEKLYAGENVSENNALLAEWDGETTEVSYYGENYKITFDLKDHWDNGYNAEVFLENTGDTIIKNWILEMPYEGDINNIWNAEEKKIENKYVLSYQNWNRRNINSGESVSFGFSGSDAFKGFPSVIKMLNGESCDSNPKRFECIYRIDGEWEEGFNASLVLYNKSEEAIDDWVLEFDYPQDISDIWNGKIISSKNHHYVIENLGYNAKISPKDYVVVGFLGANGNSGDVPQNYILSEFKMDSATSGNAQITTEQLTTEEITTEEISSEEELDGFAKLFDGSDSGKNDSDGDGLCDYDEVYVFMTNPYKKDTDENGIIDSEEDLDEDGINNFSELTFGTDPCCQDTDKDGLKDYDEIRNYYCDPLIEDTDSDGLKDGEDVKLGFSPLLKDTDANGILDCDEKQNQEYIKEFSETGALKKVNISMNISGCIDSEVSVSDISEFDYMSNNVCGLIGIPVDINTDIEFDEAYIEFTYDENELNGVAEEDISVLWYNEAENWYQILDDVANVDTENNIVSFKTTHFSTYMMVNKKEWFESWRSGVSKDGMDIVYVVGSYKQYNELFRKTLYNFVDAMDENDRGSIVVLNGDKTVVMSELTDKKIDLTSAIMNIQFKPDISNIPYNGIDKAADILIKNGLKKEKAIFLYTGFDESYNEDIANKCKANGIKVYTLVCFGTNNYCFQKLATETGGEVYSLDKGRDTTHLLGIFEKNDIAEIDKKDSDGDGLYDAYEINGIKLNNGTVIHTNPMLKDTDGDGLSDYDETGIIYNKRKQYIGNGKWDNVQYFILRSDPTKKDSDDDGILDCKDDYPWFADEVYYQIKGVDRYSDYIKVMNSNGFSMCGNQYWWDTNPNKNMDDYVKDIKHRIHHSGCGLIAATDFELYFLNNNPESKLQSEYYGEDAKKFISMIDFSDGEISRADYMKLVEYNCRDKYGPTDRIQYEWGVYEKTLEKYIQNLYISNARTERVKWAKYIDSCENDQKYEVIGQIEKMVKNDYPVIISYSTMDKNKPLLAYESVIDAENRENKQDTYFCHYLTVIGLIKKYNKDENEFEYILKVSSVGKIQYIRFDDYSRALNYFSNILTIEGTN